MYESLKKLYCIVGPSGTGKSTLVKNLMNEFDWMNTIDSYTTRPKRTEDETGHKFVSKEEFDKLELVAYTQFNGYEYGVTEDQLNDADLYVVDVAGLKQLKQKYLGAQIITVGLKASDDICKKRMASRGDTEEQIASRMLNDMIMFNDYEDYCDIVLDANGDENNLLAQFIDEVVVF